MKKYIFGFIITCIITFICFLSVSQSGYTDSDNDAGRSMHVITADMKHEHTISWKTSVLNEPAYLELRGKQSQDITRINAEGTELPSYNGGIRFMLYTAHISNLTPGTVYEYRTWVGKRSADWKEFKTEPESESFKVLIFGDSQSVNYNEWSKTIEAAWQNNTDTAFFINMGDLVDNGQDEGQWNAWFDGAENLLAAIPIAPVMGNHETYSLDWKMALPNYYLSFFAVPPNGPKGLERYAYSYDYGDVHFSVLNTQLNELQEWNPDLLEVQKKWLEEDLSKTSKSWRVILMHRGIWEESSDGLLDDIGKMFVPVFDKYHVNLVFSAHIHSYSRTEPLKNGRSDLNGTIYITTGRSGQAVWEKSFSKPIDKFYYNPLDMPNYLVLEAAHDILKIAAFKQSSELIDQAELKKLQ